jgi:hypothetical protein
LSPSDFRESWGASQSEVAMSVRVVCRRRSSVRKFGESVRGERRERRERSCVYQRC